MENDSFTSGFMNDVSKFVVVFGGFWVVFTAVMFVIFEYANLATNPIASLPDLLGIFYISRVFWYFYKDTKRKSVDPKFKIIDSWFPFVIDSVILILLTINQFIGLSRGSDFGIIEFNNISILFLGSIFQFFRFVYHFLFD